MRESDEAIRILESARRLEEDSPTTLQVLGCAYAQAGRIGEAHELLEDLKELARKTYVPSMSFANIYLSLGTIDKGFDLIEQAVEDRESLSLSIPVSPFYDPLRIHPRYNALLRKMNLEP
jgi:tetratricopeptide (TPR) repeat protein